MRARVRRHVRRPPDLTSLFDVLFIVVFVALIRAAAAQQEVAAAARPAPAPRPVAPVVPPEVAALRAQAIADLHADLDARLPLVIRISAQGAIQGLEIEGRTIELDVPLLEHSPDPDVAITYLGDRSAELRLCRVAALHMQVPSLARHLVIVAPAQPLVDLPHALYEGLHRDLDRCLAEQGGIASIVDPAVLSPPAGPDKEPVP